MILAAGDPIRIEMTKWGGLPHWQFDGVFLGADTHGSWLGFPRGTVNSRPGMTFHSEVDAVTLVPRSGWWLATFQAPGIWCEVYVDIASPARWDGAILRSDDLDLDVIRLSADSPEPRVYLDDEDEFIEHQVALGYPAEVIAAAEAAAHQIRQAVEGRDAPFDAETSADWFTQLIRLTG